MASRVIFECDLCGKEIPLTPMASDRDICVTIEMYRGARYHLHLKCIAEWLNLMVIETTTKK